MESKNDLNKHIRLTTLKIQDEYPELIKYFAEIPAFNASQMHDGIDALDLKNYLDSLNDIITTYGKKLKK
jgi:hypothetical protein